MLRAAPTRSGIVTRAANGTTEEPPTAALVEVVRGWPATLPRKGRRFRGPLHRAPASVMPAHTLRVRPHVLFPVGSPTKYVLHLSRSTSQTSRVERDPLPRERARPKARVVRQATWRAGATVRVAEPCVRGRRVARPLRAINGPTPYKATKRAPGAVGSEATNAPGSTERPLLKRPKRATPPFKEMAATASTIAQPCVPAATRDACRGASDVAPFRPSPPSPRGAGEGDAVAEAPFADGPTKTPSAPSPIRVT